MLHEYVPIASASMPPVAATSSVSMSSPTITSGPTLVHGGVGGGGGPTTMRNEPVVPAAPGNAPIWSTYEPPIVQLKLISETRLHESSLHASALPFAGQPV